MAIFDKDVATGDPDLVTIFDWARREFAKVANSKKLVVCELASRLEGKLPTEEIAGEIVSEFKGEVSERYIHEVLPAKYKLRTKPSKIYKKKEEPLSVIVEVGGTESSQIESIDAQDREIELGDTILAQHEREPTDTPEFKLISQVEDLTLKLKSRDEQIENLKASLEAKAIETELAKPKSAVSPPQQMKMDQYFQAFSDLVTTAHTEHCPAGCSTWQKASTISLA